MENEQIDKLINLMEDNDEIGFFDYAINVINDDKIKEECREYILKGRIDESMQKVKKTVKNQLTRENIKYIKEKKLNGENLSKILALFSETLIQKADDARDMINNFSKKATITTTIFRNVSPDIQSEIFEEVLELVKENPVLVESIWRYTSREVRAEKFETILNVVREDSKLVEQIWISTSPKVQAKKFEKVLEIVKENTVLVESIWYDTSPKVRDEKFETVLKVVKKDSKLVEQIWKSTSSKTRLKNFQNVIKVLKIGDLVEYKKFVKSYMGDVEFDKDNNPVIPEELKKAMLNAKEKATQLENKLPEVITNWNLIKQNLQYKKANSIINDDIEIRINIEQILSSYSAIRRVKANSSSAMEFEMTEGSEKVGFDTKYTVSVPTAVQRAHILAKKMDDAGLEKKFPDFSVQDKKSGIELRILHPQDKSAILLGYNTDSCFRPNGVADNSTETEYSLLQYCTTTQYGGVLECGKLKENNRFDVYMGTPFLVNGNCLMLHSYETKNEQEYQLVNKVLMEAAKKAIEQSNGNLNVVMMTTLHTGSGRLDISDKFDIGKYFTPYYEGEEYESYREMYHNISDFDSVLLAARVGDKILIGQDLKDWCEKECNGDKEIVKRNLGLQMGERTETYTFPDRNVRFERKVENSGLVQLFKQKQDELMEERAILGLARRKSILEGKENRSVDENQELEKIQTEFSMLQTREEDIKKLTLKQIEEKLKENASKTFEIYSGDDYTLIARILWDNERRARKEN